MYACGGNEMGTPPRLKLSIGISCMLLQSGLRLTNDFPSSSSELLGAAIKDVPESRTAPQPPWHAKALLPTFT